MATHMISSSNHNQMMEQMKFPKFTCRQSRVQSSSSSPCSVLPEFPKLKKKRPISPQPLSADQKKKKMMVVVKSLSSTATATTTSSSPLSPTKLRGALAKIRFADLILKAEKQMLEKITSDPTKLRQELAERKRRRLEEKERVEAQLREAQRMADLEAKQKQEDSEKARQARVQRQRRRERLVLDKMEVVAKCELQQPYCCTLKELGILTRCDCARSWGCWGGQHPSPLERLGLRIKEEGENDLQEVELEEGEIVDELEEGEIC